MTPAAPAGVLFDRVLDEVSRQYPLAGFGHIAAATECCMNCVPAALARPRIVNFIAWAVAVLPSVLLAAWLVVVAGDVSPRLMVALDAIALYFATGACSLYKHIALITFALRDADLPHTRALASRIVSRDFT